MGYYFIIIGTLLALGSCWAVWRSCPLTFGGAATRGTIVDVREWKELRDSFVRRQAKVKGRHGRFTTYFPVIEFETLDGRNITFTHGRAPSGRNTWVIGSDIDVRYDPRDPENATIDSTIGLLVGPLALAGLAICAFAAGTTMIQGE